MGIASPTERRFSAFASSVFLTDTENTSRPTSGFGAFPIFYERPKPLDRHLLPRVPLDRDLCRSCGTPEQAASPLNARFQSARRHGSAVEQSAKGVLVRWLPTFGTISCVSEDATSLQKKKADHW